MIPIPAHHSTLWHQNDWDDNKSEDEDHQNQHPNKIYGETTMAGVHVDIIGFTEENQNTAILEIKQTLEQIASKYFDHKQITSAENAQARRHIDEDSDEQNEFDSRNYERPNGQVGSNKISRSKSTRTHRYHGLPSMPIILHGETPR
ncbi:hypothetical protein G9A89_021691, partial [Geosiphon pyriformis]